MFKPPPTYSSGYKLSKLVLLLILSFGVSILSAQKDQMDLADSLKLAGNYSEALKIFNSKLEKDIKSSDLKGQSKDFNNIANVYSDIGDYERSTSYYFKAIKIVERLGDNSLLGGIYYNISNNYYAAGKLNYCREFLMKAIELTKNEKNNEAVLGSCYNILAGMFTHEKKYDEALVYLKKAEKLFESPKHNDRLGGVYLEIAYLGLEKPDLKLAEEYAIKSLAVFKKENDLAGISASYIDLQMVHFNNWAKVSDNLKEAKIAFAYLDSAEFVLNDVSAPEVKIRIYTNKQQIYHDLKKYDSAYVYLKKYVILNDSVHNLENNRQLDELKVQYDVEKREQENLLLQKTAQNQFYLVVILILALLAVLIVSILSFRLNRLRAKQKELQMEQQLLRLQMNPHFLFNAINSIQNYILKKSQQEAYDYLAKFAKLIRIVLNNSQEKTLVLHQELEMIDLYVEMERLRFNNNFDFNLTVGKNINEFEIAVPPMLIQPYIENAIWHGLMNLENERKGILNVDITESDGILKIVIEDNGIGREKAKQYKKEDSHRSVGMKLTEQRLLMINKMQEYENAKVTITDLRDEKDTPCGTKVEIYLPINGK